MLEIDKLFKGTGRSLLLVVHQETAYSHKSSNRITRTQICQNSPGVRTSRTNTDSPTGCIIGGGEREGDRVQQGERAGYLRAFCEERGDMQSRAGGLYSPRGSEFSMVQGRRFSQKHSSHSLTFSSQGFGQQEMMNPEPKEMTASVKRCQEVQYTPVP